jgi:hypothetical protein
MRYDHYVMATKYILETWINWYLCEELTKLH